MKKYFIIAAAALFSLAACTKNEADKTAYDQSKVINFSAVAGKATKAPVGGNYYPNDISFGVYAYALAEGKTWAANSGDGQLYMDNVEIEYSSTDDIYAPKGTTYYWPLSGSLTFIGYSPKATTGTVAYTLAEKKLTVTDFTVNETASAQQDLMYATTVSCTATDDTDKDFYKSSASDAQSYVKGVNMVFHHTLSQVKFNVKKATGLDDYTITVNSIKFNAYSKGTLAVTEGATYTVDWSGVSTDLTYDTAGSDVYAPNNSAAFAAFGEANMPVPQDLVAGTQKFTIKYSLKKGLVDLGSKTVTSDLFVSGGVESWANNTVYNYNIVIGLDKIYFNPTVTDWATAAAQEINVQ